MTQEVTLQFGASLRGVAGLVRRLCERRFTVGQPTAGGCGRRWRRMPSPDRSAAQQAGEAGCRAALYAPVQASSRICGDIPCPAPGYRTAPTLVKVKTLIGKAAVTALEMEPAERPRPGRHTAARIGAQTEAGRGGGVFEAKLCLRSLL
jgi:hypothetical protein